MAIILDGSTGLTIPSVTTTTLAYTGTLTGGTSIIAIGTNQLYKDAGGNVGIGTSSPACRLNVVSGTNNGIQVYDGTVNTLIYNTGSNTSVIGTNSNHPLALYTNNTERMRIDASGNVGIGTSSPSSFGRLTISQPALVDTTTKREVFIDAPANTTTNTAGALNGITFRMNSSSYGSQFNKTSGVYGINTDTDAGGLYGRSAGLVFYTSSIDATATEKMRIDSVGNLLVGITSASVPSTTGFVSSANTFGFKNRIINGGMVIDQRNAGAAVVPNPTTTVYPVDRFMMSAAVTSKYTAQRNAGSITPPAGFSNYLGCTVTSAYTPVGNQSFNIQTRIEGYNTADFAFGTASAATSTLSFWVYSSLIGTYGGEIYSSAARTYPFSYSIPVADTWTKITLSISGDTVSATDVTNGYGLIIVWGLGTAGTGLGGTINTWQAGNFTQPAGTVNWISNAGATFYITGVQLEKGSVATSFDQRAYSQELAMCQRYYQRQDYSAALGSAGATAFTATKYSTTDSIIANIQLATTMRTSPTISFSNAGPRCILSSGNGSGGTYISSTYSTAAGPVCVSISYNALPAGYGWIDMVGVFQASAEL